MIDYVCPSLHFNTEEILSSKGLDIFGSCWAELRSVIELDFMLASSSLTFGTLVF